jgi:hypothetical protein
MKLKILLAITCCGLFALGPVTTASAEKVASTSAQHSTAHAVTPAGNPDDR